MGFKERYEKYYSLIIRFVFLLSITAVVSAIWLKYFPAEQDIEYHDILNESLFLVLLLIIYFLIIKISGFKTIFLELGWMLYFLQAALDLLDEFTDDPDLFGSYIPNIIRLIAVSLVIAGIFKAYKRRTEELKESIKVRAKLKISEEKYRKILENIEESYFEFSNKGKLTFFNDSLCRTLQYTRKELLGMSFNRFIGSDVLKRVIAIFDDIDLSCKSSRSFDLELIRKDGTALQTEVSISPIYNTEGERCGYRGLARDVSERRKIEEMNAYFAYHDSLTGVYNRLSFSEHLQEHVAYAEHFKTRLSLFYIDLDNFKQVNDNFGHDVGDRLLCAVVDRMNRAIRETDLIFRLGGDEFAILFTNIEDIDLDQVGGELTSQLSSPYLIDECTIDFIGASIGITIFPDDADSYRDLINGADSAMYEAKKLGNSFCYFRKYNNVS